MYKKYCFRYITSWKRQRSRSISNSRIQIHIKLKTGIRIRIKVKSRIRIRRVWIRNTGLNIGSFSPRSAPPRYEGYWPDTITPLQHQHQTWPGQLYHGTGAHIQLPQQTAATSQLPQPDLLSGSNSIPQLYTTHQQMMQPSGHYPYQWQAYSARPESASCPQPLAAAIPPDPTPPPPSCGAYQPRFTPVSCWNTGSSQPALRPQVTSQAMLSLPPERVINGNGITE
jgi:hypothetical protein